MHKRKKGGEGGERKKGREEGKGREKGDGWFY